MPNPYKRAVTNIHKPNAFLMAYLREPGGSEEMTVDGSSTPVNFRYVVPEGKTLDLSRLLIHLTGSVMKVDKFAGQAALTNGVALGFYDRSDNLLLDPLDGRTIKQNYDWAEVSGVDADIKSGSSIDAFVSRWTVAKAGAVLQLGPLDYVQFKIQDAITPTNQEFRVILQGQLLNT